MPASISDKFLVILQRCVPARLIGNLIYALTRIETRWFKNAFIRVFCKLYPVNLAEAAKTVPTDYRHFNEFFTRELGPGLRPMPADPQALACPADGTLAQHGYASAGRLLQAKGVDFSLDALLGDAEQAAALSNAAFVTVYLAPYNYHRLHMPWEGELRATRFIPGLLYSVNARTTANVPGLYALNERLVCDFDSPAGAFSMVLVGAMNVASISTAWGGEIPAHKEVVSETFAPGQVALQRGAYMGHFNMGSTIVLVGPGNTLQWTDNMVPGDTLVMGQQLAAGL